VIYTIKKRTIVSFDMMVLFDLMIKFIITLLKCFDNKNIIEKD